MPEPPDAPRSVSAGDIARLAELLDRFQYADDPTSAECKEAEIRFNAEVDKLYAECVQPFYSSITYYAFRGKLLSECKRLLNRERKQPPASGG